MSPLKTLCRIASALLLGLSGSVFVNCGAYGAPMPPPLPHEPDVVLQDFSYTPASPIHAGDTIRFTARLNRHTEAGAVRVAVGEIGGGIELYDDGNPYSGDAAAGDGVYATRVYWQTQYGVGENLPVWFRLDWDDGAPGQMLSAPPLTVLPEEVVLQDLKYTPSSPIHIGDMITFTATLNKHTGSGSVTLKVGERTGIMIGLRDDGELGDTTAGDGIYMTSFQWQELNGAGENLPVRIWFNWYEGGPELTLYGLPLTVLPAEEGQ